MKTRILLKTRHRKLDWTLIYYPKFDGPLQRYIDDPKFEVMYEEIKEDE